MLFNALWEVQIFLPLYGGCISDFLWFSGKPVYQLVQQTVFTELFFILSPRLLTDATTHIFYYPGLQRSSLYCYILLGYYIISASRHMK